MIVGCLLLCLSVLPLARGSWHINSNEHQNYQILQRDRGQKGIPITSLRRTPGIVLYGDAIALKHMLSDFRVFVHGNKAGNGTEILADAESVSFFRILKHVDAPVEPVEVYERDRVLLQEVKTGLFLSTKENEKDKFDGFKLVAMNGISTWERNLTWVVESASGSINRNNMLQKGKSLRLRSVCTDSYLHTTFIKPNHMRMSAVHRAEDGYNIFKIEDVKPSTEIGMDRAKVISAAQSKKTKSRLSAKVTYGSYILLKNFVSDLHIRTVAKGSRTFLAPRANGTVFQILHETGKANPRSAIRLHDKIVLKDAETSEVLFIKRTRDQGEKIMIGHPEKDDVDAAKFVIEGVMGSLDDNAALRVKSKFMIRRAFTDIYVRTSADWVDAYHGLNGDNVFIISEASYKKSKLVSAGRSPKIYNKAEDEFKMEKTTKEHATEEDRSSVQAEAQYIKEEEQESTNLDSTETILDSDELSSVVNNTPTAQTAVVTRTSDAATDSNGEAVSTSNRDETTISSESVVPNDDENTLETVVDDVESVTVEAANTASATTGKSSVSTDGMRTITSARTYPPATTAISTPQASVASPTKTAIKPHDTANMAPSRVSSKEPVAAVIPTKTTADAPDAITSVSTVAPNQPSAVPPATRVVGPSKEIVTVSSSKPTATASVPVIQQTIVSTGSSPATINSSSEVKNSEESTTVSTTTAPITLAKRASTSRAAMTLAHPSISDTIADSQDALARNEASEELTDTTADENSTTPVTSRTGTVVVQAPVPTPGTSTSISSIADAKEVKVVETEETKVHSSSVTTAVQPSTKTLTTTSGATTPTTQEMEVKQAETESEDDKEPLNVNKPVATAAASPTTSLTTKRNTSDTSTLPSPSVVASPPQKLIDPPPVEANSIPTDSKLTSTALNSTKSPTSSVATTSFTDPTITPAKVRVSETPITKDSATTVEPSTTTVTTTTLTSSISSSSVDSAPATIKGIGVKSGSDISQTNTSSVEKPEAPGLTSQETPKSAPPQVPPPSNIPEKNVAKPVSPSASSPTTRTAEAVDVKPAAPATQSASNKVISITRVTKPEAPEGKPSMPGAKANAITQNVFSNPSSSSVSTAADSSVDATEIPPAPKRTSTVTTTAIADETQSKPAPVAPENVSSSAPSQDSANGPLSIPPPPKKTWAQ